MSATAVGLISVVVALVSGLISASVNSWLATRARVSEEMREARLTKYPPLWAKTSMFSRWPRTDATYAHLDSFHRDLRGWFYDVGGLYLSLNSRVRYGELQDIVAAHLRHRPRELGEQIPAAVYDDLMEACSAVRTALTEDLESRRQRSFWSALNRAWTHRRQQVKAQQRIDRVKKAAAPHTVLVALEPPGSEPDGAPPPPLAAPASSRGRGAS